MRVFYVLELTEVEAEAPLCVQAASLFELAALGLRQEAAGGPVVSCVGGEIVNAFGSLRVEEIEE